METIVKTSKLIVSLVIIALFSIYLIIYYKIY
jgi:hypothetical protein